MEAKDDNEIAKETAEMLRLTFDKFQRYKVVADIINKFRNNKETFKILEVGAGGEETLKKFLPHDNFIFLDTELLPEDRQKSNYILGDITEMHIKESYDFVVSIDTYEHIPPSSRKRFINETIHPSTIATIIAAPFDTPGVKESEVIVNEAYVLTYDTEYRWLHEHIQNGLPSLSYTLELIEESGLDYTVIPNGYLPRWFDMISIYLLTEGMPEFSKIITELSEFYNKNIYQYDSISPAYRQVIIIKKEGKNPDFSDILTQDFNSEDFKIKYEMLQSILRKIKELYNPYRYNQIKALENNLQEKERQINELNAAVHGKKEQILILDGKITDISSQLNEKDTQISEFNVAVHGKDAHIHDLEVQIDDISSQLNEKDKQLDELNVTVQGKDEQIRYFDEQITDIYDYLKEKDRQIDELDVSIQEKDEQIRDLEEQITDISGHQKEKERLINELNIAAQGKDEQILNLETQIADSSGQLKEREERLGKIEMENLRIDRELNSIKSSVTWRAVMKWHSFVDEVLPQGTNKRRWYDQRLIRLRKSANEDGRISSGNEKAHRTSKEIVQSSAKSTKTEAPKFDIHSEDLEKIQNIYNAKYGDDFISDIDKRDEMYQFLVNEPSVNDPTAEYFGSGELMRTNLQEVFDDIGDSFNQIDTFLDFACGYGRFTRFLVQKLNHEKITVSDIDKNAVDFVKRTFGVNGFYSVDYPDRLIHDTKYDVIFVASLFSHLPLRLWGGWLKLLYDLLNDGGILIFSTHGMNHYYLLDDETKTLVEKVEEGFYYLPKSFDTKRLSVEFYGTTYVSYDYVGKFIRQNNMGKVVAYYPKKLCDFQDIYVIKKDITSTCIAELRTKEAAFEHGCSKKIEGVTMKKNIKQFLFKPIRSALRNFLYFAIDTIDLLLCRRDVLTPPRRLAFLAGGGDSKKIGEEFLRYFIELGSLKPNESVLDVGSSIGRMAAPLTKYLDENGSYEGFDIVKAGVDWCKRKISRRCPNFHFQLADVFNKNYNPEGKYRAAEYRFPYNNESFDFVFLISVFTHMLPQDIENYISEIARVLRKDGRCLITFFLLNKESLKHIEAKKSTLDFKYVFDDYRTIDKNTPEAAIAYDEQFIRRLYDKYELIIKEPVYYGYWSGRKDFLSCQDIIIASRG